MINAEAAVAAAGSGEARTVEAVPYQGKKYFGDGPTGSRFTTPPLDPEYLVIGGVGMGAGALLLCLAVLLLRRPRRRTG